ncbi:MAG: DNA repair protein, partial [Balneolaceae bacterium]|nr:DNA repair protein [Balneolaceae bacterium]
QLALLANSQSILLTHNHPSGILVASAADVHMTKRIKKAGELLGICVEDHIILTSEGYTSLAFKGLL